MKCVLRRFSAFVFVLILIAAVLLFQLKMEKHQNLEYTDVDTGIAAWGFEGTALVIAACLAFVLQFFRGLKGEINKFACRKYSFFTKDC